MDDENEDTKLPEGAETNTCTRPSICTMPWASQHAGLVAADMHSIARVVAEHGFALLSVGPTASKAFRKCAASWQAWFETTASDQKKIFFARVAVERSGKFLGHCGFARPSAAKENFRVRRGCAVPYPPGLEDCTTCALEQLHGLAVEAQTALCGLLGIQPDLVCRDDAHYHGAANLRHAASPLDIFWYNNDPKVAEPNLSPHIDPGYVTVVPISSEPGLLLLSQKSKDFVDVEDLGLEAWAFCVVFPAHVIASMSNGLLTAALHGVRKSCGPRLSLPYELRPAPAVNPYTHSSSSDTRVDKVLNDAVEREGVNASPKKRPRTTPRVASRNER